MLNLNRNKILFTLIIIAFLATRFLGFGHIYHQDEYRWASIADPFFGNLESPHPPLPEYLYKAVGQLWNFNYLRMVPLAFSFLSLILLYLVIKKLTGKPAIGIVAAALFTVNIYSAIASLQVDIDGALLPFFVLLGYYSYLYLAENPKDKKYWSLFIIALAGGFLTKLSFLLFVVALATHLVLTRVKSKTLIFKKFLIPAAILVGAFYFLYATQFGLIIKYAESFTVFNFGSRKYFDLAFKVFKSFVWLSPLLTLPLLTGLFDRAVLKKYGFWYLYILVNLIFYVVAFDFATRTIERYFMFLIIPAVIISSDILYHTFLKTKGTFFKSYFWVKLAVILFIVFTVGILSLPFEILPLDPKTGYVQKVRSLDFNFLIPFSGGSGPSGFYFSAQFILWSWLLSLISWLLVFLKSKYAKPALLLFVVFGIGYNVLFLNEYLGKSLYGNVPELSKKTIKYILENKNIKNVITYYDVGAYYLRKSDQYSSRFYTAPSRDYTPKLSTFDGYYMIVDFPPIDKNGRYWPLISRCELVKTFTDKSVNSYIFNCTGHK